MLPITNVISRNVKTCNKDNTIFDASKIMSENNIGAIVVTDSNNKLIGILTERDLLNRVIAKDKNYHETKVEEVMTKEVLSAKEGDTSSAIYMKMKEKNIRHIPVIDSENNIVGIVSLKDVIAVMNEIILKQHYMPDSSGLY